MDVSSVFRGKRITVFGLGLLGRAAGDAEFLAECGAIVTVTDKKNEEELKESVERLKKYKNISLHLGGHIKEDFTSSDMVIRAAGVRFDAPEVAWAKKAGVPVYMSTALCAKYADEAGARVVGVTGTRGKSTVTHMIHHSLIPACRQAGAQNVFLGGNVRGVSTLALLPDITFGDIVVLELDSWQLQGFGDLCISPHIAVFTNFLQDHKNYYKNTDDYFRDKANIFRYQKTNDVLVVGGAIADRVRAESPPLDPIVPDSIPRDWKLRVLGEHNRENASFAVAALQALGVAEDDIRAGLESFEGVEGRLQFIREINGVKIYNDNNATTPEATIAALKALNDNVRPRRSNIVLILGGADKGLDMDELVEEIKRTCKAVVFIPGTGTEKIKKSKLKNQNAKLKIIEAGTLQKALGYALEEAHGGDVILFSPAFASFGMFKNEYDRNDQFLNIIKTI
ncbi:MAG TPA: UDP-N-acetylmuramoyl-L-alanine--D-glutamate ligase [Candidatus Paceibacterota bacterium]